MQFNAKSENKILKLNVAYKQHFFIYKKYGGIKTMNELTIFKNDNFGEVRTILINEVPYFVGKDVAAILGYKDTSDALKRHVDDEDKLTRYFTDSGQSREMYVVNESGLYSLILSSKMPNAKKFKRWVTSEVLPEIRKTGSYKGAPKSFKEALYLAYKQQEKIEELEKTKAWIGSRREATAMNTASQKSKEVEKLKRELDKSKEYASIKAVEMKTKRKFDWRMLRNYCTSHELEMPKIFDANYGSVRTYPAKAWSAIYEIDLEELF